MRPREIAMLGAPLIGVVWVLDLPAPDSTMGPQGDSIVGFEARVVTAEPLQVEVHGSVWRARLVEGASVSPEERVRVVGRQVLTLLVARGK